MRLSQQEVNNIITAVTAFIKPQQHVELYLYGSRTNDAAKGGDIDLLLLTNDRNEALSLIKRKHEILATMKMHIGEQKIDLKIAGRDQIEDDPFLQLILPTTISLRTWN